MRFYLPFMLLACAGVARAEPVPLCAQPEILDRVAEGIERLAPGPVLDLSVTSQTATTDTRIVRCSVRFSTPVYDTVRFGRGMRLQPGLYEYEVRIGRNGLFVSPAMAQSLTAPG